MIQRPLYGTLQFSSDHLYIDVSFFFNQKTFSDYVNSAFAHSIAIIAGRLIGILVYFPDSIPALL